MSESPQQRATDAEELGEILIKLEKLHHIRDLSTLLDSILFETRSLASADAGSIFLVEAGSSSSAMCRTIRSSATISSRTSTSTRTTRFRHR